MSQSSNNRGRKKLCDLSVESLIRHLKKRGIDSTGPKNILQARLVLALKKERGLLEGDGMTPNVAQPTAKVEVEVPRVVINDTITEKPGENEIQKNVEEIYQQQDDESPAFIINAETSDQDMGGHMYCNQQEGLKDSTVETNSNQEDLVRIDQIDRSRHDSRESGEEGEFSSRNSELSSHTPPRVKETKEKSRTRKRKDSRSSSSGSRDSSIGPLSRDRDRSGRSASHRSREDSERSRGYQKSRNKLSRSVSHGDRSDRSARDRSREKLSRGDHHSQVRSDRSVSDHSRDRSTRCDSRNSRSDRSIQSRDGRSPLTKTHSSSSGTSSKYRQSPATSPSRSSGKESYKYRQHQNYRDHVHRYVASKQYIHRGRDNRAQHQQRGNDRYEHRRAFYPPRENPYIVQGQVEVLQSENRRLKLEREKLAREKDELLRREFDRQRAERELIEKEKEELRRTKQQLEEEQRKLLTQQTQAPQVVEKVIVTQEAPSTPPKEIEERRFVQQNRSGFVKNRPYQTRFSNSNNNSPQKRDFRQDRYQSPQNQQNHNRFNRNYNNSPQKFHRPNNNNNNYNHRDQNRRRDNFVDRNSFQKLRRTSVDSSTDMNDNNNRQKSGRDSRQQHSSFRDRRSSSLSYDGASTSGARTVTIVTNGYNKNNYSGKNQDYSAYQKYDYPIVE